MFNEVILIGRIKTMPETIKYNKRKMIIMILEIQKRFKNQDGLFEMDSINVVLWKGISEAIHANCKIGERIGIRGRIETLNSNENKDQNLYVIAEGISFIN